MLGGLNSFVASCRDSLSSYMVLAFEVVDFECCMEPLRLFAITEKRLLTLHCDAADNPD